MLALDCYCGTTTDIKTGERNIKKQNNNNNNNNNNNKNSNNINKNNPNPAESEEKREWKTMVALREWNENVDDSLEFRTFVYKEVMTAISQYNHYCHFPHLHALEPGIRNAINRTWKLVKPLLLSPEKEEDIHMYENVVVDFAVVRKKKTAGSASLTQHQEHGEKKQQEQAPEWDCFVIELNPFETTTGSCLYSWRNDESILKNSECKEEELKIKLHNAPVERLGDMLEACVLPAMYGSNDNSFVKAVEEEDSYRVLIDQVIIAAAGNGSTSNNVDTYDINSQDEVSVNRGKGGGESRRGSSTKADNYCCLM